MPDVIDIIILSYAHTPELRRTTEECLSTLIASEDPAKITFRPLVIESFDKCPDYDIGETSTLRPSEPFGYHRYLNIGLRATDAPYVCFCNNDLLFKPGWASAILEAASAHPDLMSFSPVDPWLHQQFKGFQLEGAIMRGYEKMKHFTGWCFLTRRALFDRIGEFDEQFEFWYCDDDVIKTYQHYGIGHALVIQSLVKHLGSATLAQVENKKEQHRLTDHQYLYFDYKWNHRSRIVYAIKYLVMAARSMANRGK